ncbi:MAG: hypothetical protein NUV77_16580, partial [Thermoguttaceae bacterium]|nr:hypothetical protein [Thermoguttaceae bacterium]
MNRIVVLMAVVGFAGAAPAGEAPVPDRDLVLWLDASNRAAVQTEADGRVSRWADASGRGNHAVQPDPASRPLLVPNVLAGKPVVRFDGKRLLNLGRSESLAFRPGVPFSLVAVAKVAGGTSGTFLAKGGGDVDQRCYHFYFAPGRIGAVVYGRRAEAKAAPGVWIAVLVCDGRRAEILVNGQSVLNLDAGRGVSSVDVLLGARRESADNQGTYWGLVGDLAEVLVYRRALDRKELDRLSAALRTKYGLPTPAAPVDAAARIAAMKTPAEFAVLPELAGELAQRDDTAAMLRSLAKRQPTDAAS